MDTPKIDYRSVCGYIRKPILGINRPTAGPRSEVKLERGEASVQLYSLATPNGQKVGIVFEELIESGFDFSYDAFLINIGEQEQFTSGFVELNPNSRIPACYDYSDGSPVRLFESASIALYFAEKYGAFLPENPKDRAEMMNWVFWQMGSQGPMTWTVRAFLCLCPRRQKRNQRLWNRSLWDGSAKTMRCPRPRV